MQHKKYYTSVAETQEESTEVPSRMLCGGTDLYRETKKDFCFLILVDLTVSGEPASPNGSTVFKIQ